MFLPVDDNCSDLLVHEYEDSAQESWNEGDDDRPPWVWSNRANDPATVISGWLQWVRRSDTYIETGQLKHIEEEI